MKKIIFFSVSLLVLGMVGWFISNDLFSTYKKVESEYVIYKDAKNTYEFEIPSMWKILENSGLFIFPNISKDDTVDDIYDKNNIGITVQVLSPNTTDKLESLYSALYGDMPILEFVEKSSYIKEIKGADLRFDELLPQWQGKQYIIKTSKRIYIVNTVYKEKTSSAQQEQNIKKIIGTLKEY